MSINRWRDLSDDCEKNLPDDLEECVMHHARTFSVFGRVVELFVPDALQAAAHLIGGDAPDAERSDGTPQTPVEPMWRTPPSSRKR